MIENRSFEISQHLNTNSSMEFTYILFYEKLPKRSQICKKQNHWIRVPVQQINADHA